MAQLAGVDEQHLAAAVDRAARPGGLVFGEEPQAYRDAGGAEQLLGQGHHAGHQVVLDQLGADLALAAAVGGHRTVRHHHPGGAAGREVADDVLQPRIVGVACGWHAVGPAAIALPAVPVGDVERRVRHDVVHLCARVVVEAERVAPARPQVTVEAVDGQVHLRHPPGALVELLAEHRQLGRVVLVSGQELLRLHEHAARPATRVIHAALAGLQHLHDHPHHARRGVELPAPAPLRGRELRQEVLVHLPQQVARLGRPLAAELHRVEQIQQLRQAPLIDVRAVEQSRQRALQRRVVAHQQIHGLVDPLADGLVALNLGLGDQRVPPGVRIDPEHAVPGVLVRILQRFSQLVGAVVLAQFVLNRRAALIEGVRDVLEEDEPQDDVLVLRRVHGAAQLVGGLPQCVLKLLRRGRNHGFGGGAGARHHSPFTSSDRFSVNVTAPGSTERITSRRSSST